jgi:hypothetical protein
MVWGLWKVGMVGKLYSLPYKPAKSTAKVAKKTFKNLAFWGLGGE